MKSANKSSVEKLRKILFEEDSKKIDSFVGELERLKEQIGDQESLIEVLEPVIADLLNRKIADSKDEMAAALAPVMGDAIRTQISEAKDDMVDALYPVIGQTIRKSVSESMKNLVTTVNRRIDQALSGPILATRLKSTITGVSKGELVLKDALPFKIDEIFLIHKESGLLIAHASSVENQSSMDKDLVSGMLTAIRDFVSEVFNAKQKQDLEEIQYGDSKILLDFGRYSYFAFVISGVEPTDFREDIEKLSHKLFNRYHKKLRNFDGDMTEFGDITNPMKAFIVQINQEHALKTAGETKSYFKYIGGFLVSILLIIALWSWLPGFLRNLNMQKKIRTQVQNVVDYDISALDFDVDNSWLTVSGTVSSMDVRSRIDSVLSERDDYKGYTLDLDIEDRISSKRYIQENIEKQLSGIKFPGKRPIFIIEDDIVTIEGEVADLETKRRISHRVSDVRGVHMIINNLQQNESLNSSMEIKQFLKTHTIFFDVNNFEISAKDTVLLNEIITAMKANDSCKLLVKGYSDNTSSVDYNMLLSKNRADKIHDYLRLNGLSDEKLEVSYHGETDPLASNSSEEGRARNRRVEFDIIQER